MEHEDNGTVDLLRAHLKTLENEFKEFKKDAITNIEKIKDKVGWILLIIVLLSFFAGVSSSVNVIKFILGK